MAYRLFGGLLAAATMLTPLVPAYAASDTGIGAQISNRIVVAQRDDRRGPRGDRSTRTAQRGDRSERSTKRGERSRGEARQQATRAPRAEARREARSERRDDRQTRRGQRSTIQARVATNEYRRGDRQDRRRAYRQDRREDTRSTTRDRSGATAVNRYRDQRRATAARTEQHRYDRRDDRRSWSRDWRRDHRYDYRNYRKHHRNTYRLGRYRAPYRDYRYRRLTIGFSIGSLFYGNRYWINDPWQYRLPPTYYPYRWVRYYDDALLVDTRRGRVVDVIYGVFW